MQYILAALDFVCSVNCYIGHTERTFAFIRDESPFKVTSVSNQSLFAIAELPGHQREGKPRPSFSAWNDPTE